MGQAHDSVFSWLFSKPETLRELYGAIAGVELPPDVSVSINTLGVCCALRIKSQKPLIGGCEPSVRFTLQTPKACPFIVVFMAFLTKKAMKTYKSNRLLEGVLFKARMNDISFTIGDKIVVLIEHQSTINENMPLRLFMYIEKVYEIITGDKDLYRGKRIPLPLPEFIVLYNGTAPYPDKSILKLSDAFSAPSDLGLPRPDFLSLELIVKVYNINRGHNEEIARRSGRLEGYSTFIAKVRENRETMEPEEAMKMAVKDCISNNIEPFPKPLLLGDEVLERP